MSGGGATGGHLETPTLDREAADLLRDISEHGGYAYAAMSGLAAEGDVRAAEAAREMAWEQLHSGPWHSVLPLWRDAYSMACLHVARLHYRGGELKEALRVLDLGLIMGGTLLRKDLEAAVEKLGVEARDARVLGGEEGLDKRLVREGIDRDKVLQILPIKSLSLKTVAKRSALSLEGFLRDFFLSDCPVVITDCMSQWPARTKWNDMDYLKTIAGDRTVPVEVINLVVPEPPSLLTKKKGKRKERRGSNMQAHQDCFNTLQVGKNYLCSEWKQELITFSQFLERLQSNDPSAADPTYLAQHPLFDQINELRKDILIPDYCFAGGGDLKSLNAWFGPAGTVTPLHHDPHHNILAQVVGAKYVRLYSSFFSEELYPHSETMLCNSSKVDLDDIDEKECPKFMDLEFMDCILEEGEMLYIPPKWWHYVRSLTTSFSVSFWWSKPESPTDS